MTRSVVPTVAGAMLTAILTCRPTDTAREATPARRWFDVPPSDVAWVVAGARDSVAGNVGALAADDSLVYLLDRERGDVLALDPRSGRRRWRWHAPTAEDSIRAATAPAAGLSTSERGVVVARRDGTALVELDRRGRTIRATTLDRREFLFGVCALAGDHALIATARSTAPWRLVRGRATSRVVPPPWADAVPRPAVAWQGALVPLPGHDGCAIALSVGEGFAVVASDGAVRAASYVEPVPAPKLVDHRVRRGARTGTARKLDAATIAATGVALRGETLYVAFAGSSSNRGRLIDRYLWRSGRYAGSLRLPVPGARIAISGDLLLVLSDGDGESSLRAYHRRQPHRTAAHIHPPARDPRH